MIMLTLVTILLLLVTYIFYLNWSSYKYWEKKGIPYIQPVFFFGNIADNAFFKKSVPEMFKEFYKLSTGVRYIGCYQFLKPTLFVRDPDLINQITVKDFNTFPDHNLTASKSTDPLFAHNLLCLTSKTGWHKTRVKMIPTFAPSKLKTMVPFMQECSNHFVDYLNVQKGVIELEIRDFFRKISNDIIAGIAFGVTVNSIEDANNKFFTLGKKVADFNGFRRLLFFGYTVFPTIMKCFRLSIYSSEMSFFFRNLIEDSLKTRQERYITRHDWLDLLLSNSEANEQTLDMSVDEITAHSLLFFIAGFESVSTALALATYQLALNPDIQQKLYNEINEFTESCIGNLSYNEIMDMKYLNSFILETFRMHPPNSIIERKSLNPYTIVPKNLGEKPLHLDKNTFIWIPVEQIQKDPNYFPNPEVFDPERFNDENKKNIKPCTFIPFGHGPRTCIASRLVKLEMKVVLIEILKNYEFVCAKKTEIPLTFKSDSFFVIPKNGVWVGLKARK